MIIISHTSNVIHIQLMKTKTLVEQTADDPCPSISQLFWTVRRKNKRNGIERVLGSSNV